MCWFRLATTFCLFILFFFTLPVRVFAATTSYLVTDAFTAPPPDVSGVGRIFFWTSVTINPIVGQKVFLSRNADGTGSADVGDMLQVLANFKTFTFTAHDPLCLTTLPMSPQDITSVLSPGWNSILIRMADWCGKPKTVSSLYLVVTDPILTPTPSPVPTPLPTPTPAPFLDLPWDYAAKGLSFTEAALAINSYFDHTLPLLSGGLVEPDNFLNQINTFKNENSATKQYSSHDGYDYGLQAKVNLGDQVLAAAPGRAKYVNTCGACGNMIVIDHQNGYQTRYMHLQKDGLVITDPAQSILVERGQPVGKVGATGNVSPPGFLGAHIHVDVTQDKNHDGNFEDNIPDGMTDPFGWQSSAPDPWEQFTFFFNGLQRTGNKSFYLWKQKLDATDGTLTSAGATFTSGRFQADFPADAVDADLALQMQSNPVAQVSSSLTSIGSTIDILLKDALGNVVQELLKPFTLTVDFNSFDLMRFKPGTVSLYSSPDGQTWTKEDTTIDWDQKKASAQITHLTHFALMAERADTIPPTTTARFVGLEGNPHWYRSEVELHLDSVDNDSGLGVAYTLYQKDGCEREVYVGPLMFTEEGHHAVTFYSVDKDGNIESAKTVAFDIDKTVPEATVYFDGGKPQIVIEGNDASAVSIQEDEDHIRIIDAAGNMLTFSGSKKELASEAELVVDSLQYNDTPLLAFDDTLRTHYVFDPKTQTVRKLEQSYMIHGDLKVQLDYDAQTDVTTRSVKERGEEKTNDYLPGQKILQLTTDKGTLKYSY